MKSALNPPQETHAAEPQHPNPWVQASLAVPTLLSSLGTSIANVGLPHLSEAFQAPMQQVQWVVILYLLATTTLVVTAGQVGDLLGRKKVLRAGLLLFTLGSILCALAPSPAFLVAARGLQGVGAAAMLALPMALVGATVPENNTGRTMGLLGTVSALGTALGPALGGLLVSQLGWTSLFYVLVPLGVLGWHLTGRFLPADPATITLSGFDVPGTVLLALTLTLFALAFTGTSLGLTNLLLLGMAFVSGGFFVHLERRIKTPLLHLALFQNPALTAGFVMNVLVTTVVMATLVVGPFYLSDGLSLGAAQVGLTMACGPLVAAFTGVPAGQLVDRFGVRMVALFGLGLMLAGTLSLGALAGGTGQAGYLLSLIMLTAGYALFQAANNTGVMERMPSAQRGVRSGLLGLSRNLGLITGSALMGTLFAMFSSTHPGPSALQKASAGLEGTFLVAAVLVGVALLMQVLGRPGRTSALQKP